jgi:hypothetical protein
MGVFSFDKDYAEYMLSKAYRTNVIFHISAISSIGLINFVYADKAEAYSSLSYLHYRLKDITLLIDIEISDKNELSIDFFNKDNDISMHTKTKNFNTLELSNFIESGKLTFNMKMFIGCYIPKQNNKWEAEPFFIMEEDKEIISCINGELYKFGNDGFQLISPEPLSF